MKIEMNSKKLMTILLTFFFFIPVVVYGLDLDEKLTLRILSVSESKKTILINRGLEDGLVVDNHAKFFLTTGVIARGIVIKASPTRSIWSIYRLIAPDQMLKDKVLNLKISSAVKLTKDPSRILNPKSFFASRPSRLENHYNGVPIESYATGREGKNFANNEKELESMLAENSGPEFGNSGGLQLQKTIEFFGTLHFNGLSTSSSQEDVESFSGKQAFSDLTLGFEKYFRKLDSLLHSFSLMAFIHRTSTEISNLDKDVTSQTIFGYGLGVNWHWGNDPLSFGRPIGFINFSGGFGTATEEVSVERSSLTIEESYTGSANFFSLGVGGKYYTNFGMGARILLDYYSRGETYEVADGSNFSRTASGPRLQVGLSYRW